MLKKVPKFISQDLIYLAVLRRIEEYRAKNQEDNNVLNFFDERDLFPCRLSVESNTIEQVLAIMFKQIGKPHNYGPSEEQKQEKKRREAEEQVFTIN